MKKRSLISLFFLIFAIVTFNGCGDNSAKFSPRLNAPLASQEAGQKKCKPLIGVFVDNQNASGVTNGKSWASAYTSIGAALASLPENGGKVYVAAGTYNEELEIKDKKNISIIGGYKSTDLCEKALKDIDEADWFTFRSTENSEFDIQGHQLTIIKSSENISFSGIKFVRNDYDSAVLIEGDDNTTSVRKISFTNVSFESDSSKKFGGGIEAKNMTGLFLNQVTFNELKTYDGCLAIDKSEGITVSNSSFSTCSSAERGGSIAIQESNKINLLSLDISNSTSAQEGGGIAIADTTNVKFNGVSFDKNSLTAADGKGGALFFNRVTDAIIDLSGKNITGNIVEQKGKGAAFYISDSKNITFKGGTFADNGDEDKKAQLGGAFYIVGTENFLLENVHLKNNNAADYGGAAFFENLSGNITLTNNKFSNNNAQYGGGLVFNDIKNNLLIDKCTFEENQSDANGGALLVVNTDVQIQIKDSLFVANNAKSYGGALAIEGINSTPQVATTGTTKFERNSSEQDDGGGAIFLAIPEITGAASPHTYLFFLSDFAFVQNTTKNGQGEALRIVNHDVFNTDDDISAWVDEKAALLNSYVNLGNSILTYNPGIDQKSIVFKKEP